MNYVILKLSSSLLIFVHLYNHPYSKFYVKYGWFAGDKE